eukprot:TRINITY_DN8935_c0_g1_i1.p1 TRINITY_DN8935_c0_g1~~TRINITY_DN8935_c0_g1_i1.p1  ORF type:complete len:442 (+),score=76.63 TRINITY_DN8935_c0_g1_i1:3-1328(+)
MDLPVIMMSANAETSTVMKGITHGACDYLIKPVRIEAIKNIFQHVIRKRVRVSVKDEAVGDSDDSARNFSDFDLASKKRKEKFLLLEDPSDDLNTMKKARVLWSKELHEQFVQAVNHIGIDRAVPTKILEVMNVQGLTRENVASHLQKYRQYLKRLSGIPVQHHPVAAFQASGNGSFGGVMHIQPGGKSSGSKGVNLGSGTNSNMGRAAMGGGQVDQATLLTLSQLQAAEQTRRGTPVVATAGPGIVSPGSNARASSSAQYPPLQPLQRLSSTELDNLMCAHEDSLARQQRPTIPGIREELGPLTGLGNLRMGEDLTGLPSLANLKGEDMIGTLPDFLPSKEEQVTLSPLVSAADFDVDRFRDFGSPSPFSTVSSLSGGGGSDSSFSTYSEFAGVTGDFLGSPRPDAPTFLSDVLQPEGSRPPPPYRPPHLQGQQLSSRHQ